MLIQTYEGKTITEWALQVKAMQAALAEKDQELVRVSRERDTWHEIVKDDCEDDETFRKAAGRYDQSDSLGIDSHTVILERVKQQLDTLIGEAVWAMETIQELIKLKLDRKDQTWGELEKECLAHPYFQHAQRVIARPDVREWQERQKEQSDE